MAKNEIPYYTKTARQGSGTGGTGVNITLITAGAEDSKVLFVGSNHQLTAGGGAGLASILITLSIFDGTTNKIVGVKAYSNTTPGAVIYSGGINLLDDFNFPKDKNGNRSFILPAGSSVRINYQPSTSGGGYAVVFTNAFAHVEDF